MSKATFIAGVLVTLALLVLAQFYLTRTSRAELDTVIYDVFNDSGMLDRRYDKFIHYAFGEVSKEIPVKKSIAVNAPYDPEAVNVYVLNLRNVDAIDQSTHLDLAAIKDLALMARNNFIALPSNTIFIDAKFLSLLVMTAYNANLSFSQAMQALEEVDSLDEDALYTAQSYAFALNITENYLRFGNISTYQDDPSWYAELDSLGATIVEFTAAEGSDALSLLLPYFYFMIAHELAHIQSGDLDVSGWSNISELIADYSGHRDIESQADQLAMKAVKNYLSRTSETMLQYAYIQTIVELAETMRDLVLVEIYEGFRGHSARDVLMTIVEKYPMTDEQASLPYLNPARLDRAEFNLPPIMTEQELQEVIDRLRTNGSSVTHQHMLLRGIELLKSLKDFETYTIADESQLFLGFDNLLTAPLDSAQAAAQYLNGLNNVSYDFSKSTSIPFDKLKEPMEQSFVVHKAISPSDTNCYVGYRDTSYIEICEKNNFVSRFNLVRHITLHLDTDDTADIQNSIDDMAVMLWFTVLIAPALVEDAEAFETLWGELLELGSVSIKHTQDNYLVTLGKVNNTAAMRLTAGMSY